MSGSDRSPVAAVAMVAVMAMVPVVVTIRMTMVTVAAVVAVLTVVAGMAFGYGSDFLVGGGGAGGLGRHHRGNDEAERCQ